MTKVERKMVLKDYCTVEHGLDANLKSPSSDLFGELVKGHWQNFQSEEYPDEGLPKLYDRLRDLARRLAKGEYLPNGSFNRLNDGIWELKVANVRVTFFDTPGDGTFEPKFGTTRMVLNKPYPDLPEEFDEYIRLGVVWEKVGERPTQDQLDAAVSFRKEDVCHDLPAESE